MSGPSIGCALATDSCCDVPMKEKHSGKNTMLHWASLAACTRPLSLL